MESIPESLCETPPIYRGISQLEIPIGLPQRNLSYSGLDNLDNSMMTSSIQTHEARVLRLSNKTYPDLNPGDLAECEELPAVLRKYTLDGHCEETSRDESCHLTEQDLKHALIWAKQELFQIREHDRRLLRQFIEIRFRIESLASRMSRWSRAVSMTSCHDLVDLSTLPRSQPAFRPRALSLRTPTNEYSSITLRHTNHRK